MQCRNYRANLYARKMTLNDNVTSAIEKSLLSSPASYPFFGNVTKTFLASADLRSWKQENFFTGINPQTCILFNTNEIFLGNNRLNSFHYRKFGLKQLYIYRK